MRTMCLLPIVDGYSYTIHLESTYRYIEISNYVIYSINQYINISNLLNDEDTVSASYCGRIFIWNQHINTSKYHITYYIQ